MKYNIGTFEVKTPKVIVTDPCYDPAGVGYNLILGKVKLGTWFAHVNKADHIQQGPSSLVAVHKDHLRGKKTWNIVSYDIGVDSGQAGIFELDSYRRDDLVTDAPRFVTEHGYRPDPTEPGDLWYAMCCDKTLYDVFESGMVSGGVVSRTKYGDGCYTCEIAKNADLEVVGIRVKF
jgi:hypothetical protein